MIVYLYNQKVYVYIYKLYIVICYMHSKTVQVPVELPGIEAASSSMKEKRTTVRSNQFLGSQSAIKWESTSWVVESYRAEKYAGGFGMIAPGISYLLPRERFSLARPGHFNIRDPPHLNIR